MLSKRSFSQQNHLPKGSDLFDLKHEMLHIRHAELPPTTFSVLGAVNNTDGA